MQNDHRVSIGMLVCRGDGHAIGKVERVEAGAFWIRGTRLPLSTIARLTAACVFLDASAGRYLSYR